jgi:hypothetical protein
MKSRKSAIFIFIVFFMLVASSCATGKKKPKCRTCPKWEDQIQFLGEWNGYEEEHGSGKRP